MRLTASGAAVAVKRKAVEPVNSVKNFPVVQKEKYETRKQTEIKNRRWILMKGLTRK
jgi:hypothetical protein